MTNRRSFILGGTTITAAAPFVLYGCGSGADQQSALLDVDDFEDTIGVISANHGHVATISVDQLQSQSPVVLDIRGTSTHTHAVDVTGVDLARLRSGEALSLRTTADATGHTHSVSFRPLFGATGIVETNHGHIAFLSPDKFKIAISIQGSGNHDHSLILTLEEMIKIRDGQPLVTQAREGAGHAHDVVFHPPSESVGTISANHGHVAALSSLVRARGRGVALEIKGASNHSHTVTVSEGDLAQLLSGGAVSLTSTDSGGHVHIVTFQP
jgi:hypothetical protein